VAAKMNDPYSARHAHQRLIKNADQAEFAAIQSGASIVDQGIYDDRVADAMDDYDPELGQDMARWQHDDLQIDTAVGQAQEEIERRAKLLGDAYPFELQGGSLTYRASASGFYEFCLAISVAEQITAGEHVKLPRAFERLSSLLVKGFFGARAKSMHVGTPRGDGAPAKFGEAMKLVHESTGEWIWGPDPDLPDDPADTGDHGVDFIVWNAPPDGRAGSAFILGQCACGDDWTDKFADVDLPRYGKWFNPLCYVHPPLKAFTTPHHVGDGFLHEALRRAGLVFDRARLTLLANDLNETAEYAAWAASIATLTSLVITLPSGT
jgi:hypothetical protein